MPIYNAADSIIAAFEAGRQLRLQREQQQQQDADRAMEREILKHRLASLKLDDRLRSFKTSIEAAQMQSGQPAASYPPEAFDFTTALQPAADQTIAPGVTLPATAEGQTRETLRPQMVPGVPELGIPTTPVPQQTKEQGLAEHLASLWTELRLKGAGTPGTIPAGGVRTVPGAQIGTTETIAGPPREEPTVTIRTMEHGKPVTKVLPRSQAVGQSFPGQPRPDAGSRLTKRDQVKDLRAQLTAALTEGEAPEALTDLQQVAKELGLSWKLELSMAKSAALNSRLKAARTGQLLETVPRDPLTGKPLEEPNAARDRRLDVADQILRGDEPGARQLATRAEVEALAAMWQVPYAEAKRRVEADGKTVIEK